MKSVCAGILNAKDRCNGCSTFYLYNAYGLPVEITYPNGSKEFFRYTNSVKIASHNLCFTRGGLLVREFDEIFSDLFSRRSRSYKEIVMCLAVGPKELSEICKELKKSRGGVRNKYLDDLVKAGFVQRDFTWYLETGKEGKLSRYRLSDNYLRFYLKYISRHLAKIEKGNFSPSSLTSLPGWDGIMGLQFENLVVRNYKTIWKLSGISPEEVIMDGPFFQRPKCIKRRQVA